MKKIEFNDTTFTADYLTLKSSRKMAEIYGCDKKTIIKHVRELGIEPNKINRGYKLSEKDKEEIICAYEKESSTELADRYGVSRGMITKLWYDHNLIGKTRRFYMLKNEDFFSVIDTDEKAYWLGFIMADGNVSENKKGMNSVRIGLQISDENHLKKFCNAIGTDKPILTSVNNSGREYASIEISSDVMFNDLKLYGCVPRKTWGNTWVDLNNPEMQAAFIRGYFDGDGSISNNFEMNSLYRAMVSISGFKSNVEKFRIYLENIGIHASYRQDNSQSRYKSELPFGAIAFPNKLERYKFLKFIYPETATVYLERKYILAMKYIELYELNPRTWVTTKQYDDNANYKSSKIGEARQSRGNTEVSDRIA
jgi:hypothetical protein